MHLVLPNGGHEGIELVELDAAQGIWGGLLANGMDAYGTIFEVIAALSGRPQDDRWVREAGAALIRESGWGKLGGWRRPVLEVVQGTGQMFHATAAVNRRSIFSHGLDWRRMGAASGIAGSGEPELAAVFVCDAEEVSFFVWMARAPADVWAIDVAGLWMETGPDGWWIICHPVGAERLTLVRRDIPVTRSL